MQRAGEILKGALGKFARCEDALEWIQAVWPIVLGSRLAARTQPVDLHNGVLDVAVRSDNWRRELETMTESLCTALNRAWGGKLIGQVKLSSDHDHPRTPFIRRGAQRKGERARR